jgi:O-antigen/teichoic acid export membrane protein
LSGAGVRVVLQFVVLAVLARLLMPEEFGLIGAAMVVMAFSDILSQIGIGLALVQRAELKEDHLRTGFTCSVAFGGLSAMLIWLLSPTIAHFFRMEGLAAIISVLVLRLPMQGFSAVAEALLQRHLQFRRLAAIDVFSFLGYSVVGIALATLGFGVWALVGGHLAFAASRTICLVIVQPHRKALQLKAQAVKDLAYFSGGITVARTAEWLAVQGGNLVVGRWLGAEALGLYGRAYQLTVTPSSEAGKIVEKVLFPAMASVQSEPQRLAEGYRRGAGLMGLLIVPLSVALFVLGPEIIYVLLGPDWSAAVAPFRILAVGMFFRAGYKLADTLARSKGALYEVAWRYGVYAALVVAGAWMAHPFGIEGVAFAIAIALTAHFFLMTQLSLRITNTSWSEFYLTHVPAAVLAAITFVLVLSIAIIARHYNLPAIVTILTAGAVTLSCMLILIRLIPSRILGRHGAWLLEALSGLR